VPRDWDAPTYEQISAPIAAMGLDVLSRLELEGDETVLDAGCGTGKVTAALLERLPRGRVIAVDGSPSMIEQARERLPVDRVEFHVADLTELDLDEPVDHILSTATFHWIPDHDALFTRLHALLRPGGTLVAQCGGEGNIASVLEAIRRVGGPLADWEGPWNFQSPEATAARLERIGFGDVRTWRTEWPVDVEEPFTYFATVMLGSHLERLREDEREAYVQAVVAELDHPVQVDYVRLNIVGSAASSSRTSPNASTTSGSNWDPAQRRSS
jgi:trans-aconitate 2-methyltransferase